MHTDKALKRLVRYLGVHVTLLLREKGRKTHNFLFPSPAGEGLGVRAFTAIAFYSNVRDSSDKNQNPKD